MGFFDDFMGVTQRDDITAANNAAKQRLAEGKGEFDERTEQAYGLFSPYAKQGGQANAMYGQAIGLGTDAERAAAQSRYFSDPAFQQVTSNQQNAMLRNLNARGLAGGGLAAQTGSRIALDNYGDWLNRLQTQGGQGYQATTAQAGIRGAQGEQGYQHSLTDAGRMVNYGNALAETRSIGINNLLANAKMAAKVLSGGAG